MIVVSSKKTKIESLKKVKKMIDNVGGIIGGVVINKMPLSQKTYQNKYYYHESEEKENMEQKERQEQKTKSVEDILEELEENTAITIEKNTEPIEKEQKEIIQTEKPTYYAENFQQALGMINSEISSIKTLFAQKLMNEQNQIKENIQSQQEIAQIRNNIDELKTNYEFLIKDNLVKMEQTIKENNRQELGQIKESIHSYDRKLEENLEQFKEFQSMNKEQMIQQIYQMLETIKQGYEGKLQQKVEYLETLQINQQEKNRISGRTKKHL